MAAAEAPSGGAAADRWQRLLGPAERGAALLGESLRDPLEPLHRRRRRRRLRDRLIRLIRRGRRRLGL